MITSNSARAAAKKVVQYDTPRSPRAVLRRDSEGLRHTRP